MIRIHSQSNVAANTSRSARSKEYMAYSTMMRYTNDAIHRNANGIRASSKIRWQFFFPAFFIRLLLFVYVVLFRRFVHSELNGCACVCASENYSQKALIIFDRVDRFDFILFIFFVCSFVAFKLATFAIAIAFSRLLQKYLFTIICRSNNVWLVHSCVCVCVRMSMSQCFKFRKSSMDAKWCANISNGIMSGDARFLEPELTTKYVIRRPHNCIARLMVAARCVTQANAHTHTQFQWTELSHNLSKIQRN